MSPEDTSSVRQAPSVVAFDVGGVLVHPDGDLMAATIGDVTGHVVDPYRCVDSLHFLSDFCHINQVSENDDRSRHAWAGYLGVGHDRAEAMWLALRSVDSRLWTDVDDEAVLALEMLRKFGIGTAVISNADGTLKASLARKGLLGYFDLVIDSGEVGIMKPDPAIYQLCLDGLDVAADEAWFIGDGWGEVAAAAEIGFAKSILYRRRGELPEVPRLIAPANSLLGIVRLAGARV